MHVVPRPFIAAGVAMVGASAIAISPIAAAPPDIRTAPASLLAATTDWADVLSTASDNATALFNEWREAPAPILQQIAANLRTYLMELPDVAGIAAQIQSNFQGALSAPLAVDESTLDTTHRTFYQLLPAIQSIPGVTDLLQLSISPTGQKLLDFSTTALSGVLLGMAGPVLGPLIVLASAMQSIQTDLSSQDMTSALGTLATIPAAMTDAFLNGGEHVDLTALAKAFGPAIGVSFPDGVQVGIALGGLLSPGGSIFNALDFAYDNDLLGVVHIHVPLATGTAVGPVGAMMEFSRAIAKALGWTSSSGSSAAVKSAAAQSSPAAANEVPASVQSYAASSARLRLVKVDKTIATSSTAGGAVAKRTVGGKHPADGPSAAAGSSGAAKSGGQGRSARSAAS